MPPRWMFAKIGPFSQYPSVAARMLFLFDRTGDLIATSLKMSNALGFIWPSWTRFGEFECDRNLSFIVGHRPQDEEPFLHRWMGGEEVRPPGFGFVDRAPERINNALMSNRPDDVPGR